MTFATTFHIYLPWGKEKTLVGAFSVMYNFSDSSFTALILSLSDLSSRWWGWVVSECLCQAELSHCGQEWPAAAGSVSWALEPGHRVITWPHHHHHHHTQSITD